MTVNTILIIITVLVFFGLIGFFIYSVRHAPFMNEDEMPAALGGRQHPPQNWKPFCADLSITIEEWKRRFKARIVARLMLPKPDDVFTLDHVWIQSEAEQAAESELSSVELSDIYAGYENDPEASADECMSYWGDGA